MQLKRVLTALTKAGCVIKHEESSTRYYATKGDTTLLFYENGKGSGEVYHFTCRSPDTDAMRDYFADSYFHTIKSAVRFLTENRF